MAFERIDLVQDVSTTSGTAAFVPAGTPPQGMQAFSVHTVGATFRYRAFVGAQWEIGTGTWNGTNIARAVRKSSNGNALVNFSATPTIMEVVDAADVAAFLTAADGVEVTSASSISDADSVLVIQGGIPKMVAASVMKAYYGAGGTTPITPAQTITVATPATQTVGTQFPVTGAFANGTPTALDYRLSDDAAGVWTAAPSPTINAGAGTFTFNLTPASTSAGRTISVRDRTTLVSGTSGSYVVNAAAGGGTGSNPGVTQYPRIVDLTGSNAAETGPAPYSYKTNFAGTMSGLFDLGFASGQDGSFIFEPESASAAWDLGIVSAGKVASAPAMDYRITMGYTSQYVYTTCQANNATNSAVAVATTDKVRVSRSGTTLTFDVSKDGTNWTPIKSYTGVPTGAFKFQVISQYSGAKHVSAMGLG